MQSIGIFMVIMAWLDGSLLVLGGIFWCALVLYDDSKWIDRTAGKVVPAIGGMLTMHFCAVMFVFFTSWLFDRL